MMPMAVQQLAALTPGDRVWDYATKVPYPTLTANRVTAVGRYIPTSVDSKGQPVISWKSLTVPEIATLHHLGIGVLPFWEAGGTDPLQGYPKGRAHGQTAVRVLEAQGVPHGMFCSAAVDYDVTPANTRASAEYMRGFHEQLAPAGYATAVYGDTDIIRACAADGTASVFHMAGAMSWSNRKVIDLVHLLQSISGSAPLWDNNYVLRPLDMWLPHTVPDIPPTPTPVPVPIPVPVPPAPSQEDLDAMIYSPAAAYDSRTSPDGPLQVRVPGKSSRTPKVAPGFTRAQVIITPIGVTGRGHLRWSGDGVEPDFSAAQFWTGSPPMPLSAIVDLNGDGALDVWVEGEDGAACDVIISRTHVNG